MTLEQMTREELMLLVRKSNTIVVELSNELLQKRTIEAKEASESDLAIAYTKGVEDERARLTIKIEIERRKKTDHINYMRQRIESLELIERNHVASIADLSSSNEFLKKKVLSLIRMAAKDKKEQHQSRKQLACKNDVPVWML